jgi:hypothetical protein
LQTKETTMKPRYWMPLALALAAAAAPVLADDAGKDPARNEVSVYGGISILDAHSSQQATISLPAIPGFPGFPGMPGWPATGPTDIQVNTQTKLGNSALLGVRYAFYLRKQLALEADFSVAPSAELQGSVGVCGASRCYGRGDYAGAGSAQGYDTAMNGFFAGPMGGRFRGMEGVHGGQGRFDGGYGFGGRSVTAWHYGGGLLYDILGGDVRPFLVLGAGGVTYDGTATAKTDFALRFGGGLKVYFGRLGARVDAVDYLVFNNFLSGRDEHDVHLTGGAFVRF